MGVEYHTYREANMSIQRTGGKCSARTLMIYNLLFWASGIVLVIIGIWVQVDPRRNYVLRLVHLSEKEPYLYWAAWICVIAGAFTLLVGFLACVAAIRRLRCMLAVFMIFLVLLFVADIAIGTLAWVYRAQFTLPYTKLYLTNMTKHKYGRDYWVQPLLDTIQFYQSCCGGEGPRDYEDSFWFITNNLRGTRSWVPPSCCKQMQAARAWSIQPINPMCITYYYNQTAFQASVHTEGCYQKMHKWLNEMTLMFIIIGFSFAGLMMVGLVISVCLCNNIRYYVQVEEY